ncbi:MAG: TIGR03086 family metal-binding protein [Ornithinimicrobium sp.]
MATFVLIPGAGGAGAVYWHEVVAELQRHGHTAIPVEIAGDDPSLGLPEYAAITDDAIGEHTDVVLVTQSMGGFTAPMLTKLDRVSRIVFLNAMIPLPGETPGQWFDAVGQQAAFEAAAAVEGRPATYDLDTIFLHDIPAEVRAAMAEGDRNPAETPFGQPCTFHSWPDVPMHVLVGADDRMFPADFQVRVAKERLGLDADVMPGGHLVARSRPVQVAEKLLACLGSPVGFTLDASANELRRLVTNVRDDQLDAATPCTDWNVRDLAAHICGLTVAFTHAAHHEATGAPPPETELPPNWREQLSADLDVLIAAWRDPAAWQGEAEAGGITMAAADLATVALDELVLHGWDLARATDQEFTATDQDIAICTSFAAAMSTPETLPSRQGLYGPVIDTGADPAPLDALLGLAGRTPSKHSPLRA